MPNPPRQPTDACTPRPIPRWRAVVLACAIAVPTAGCQGRKFAHKVLDAVDNSHYVHLVSRVEFAPPEARRIETDEPRRVRRPTEQDYWDVSLTELIQIALANVAVIRDRNQFLSPSNSLLANPDVAPSAFDPAIQETGGPFGGRSVDAALADFDATFSTGMLWGRDEQIQNNRFLSGGLQPGATLTEESALFTSRIDKYLPTGGSVALMHNWDYSLNNAPTRLYGSVYTGSLRGEFRQPLLAGSGADFNRTAGPLGRNGRLSVNQGVTIARLNTQISVLDFENRVQGLVKNIEDAYWDLSVAYKIHDSEATSREAAYRLWEQLKGRIGAGLEGVGAADAAQAQENYYERCSLANDALTAVYQREAQLRRLIGLPVNDGRMIRPAEPLIAGDPVPDWNQSLAEALTRRIELRRQKRGVQSLAAQLSAARSLTRPQLDFVSGYNVNAFGDSLAGSQNGTTASPSYPSAYSTLVDNDQTGWNLGLQFSMPLGFRAAGGQEKNLELRLAKANAVLGAQEHEISHELANAYQLLDRWQSDVEFNESRREAAERRVESLEADYKAGRTNVDLLLRAQISLSQAQTSIQRSLGEFRKGMAELHYRKGTLLESHNIAMAEGVWDPDAYARTLSRNLGRITHTPLPPSEPEEPATKSELAPLPEPVPPTDAPGAGVSTPAPGALGLTGIEMGASRAKEKNAPRS